MAEVPSAYIDTRFVVGTNNMCERVFSRARRIGTEFRSGMDPLTFEAIIFLKINKDLWGPSDVAQALKMDPSKDFSSPSPGLGFEGFDRFVHRNQDEDSD